jgi:crossover junction endodeoxyribonuclease RuvC
LRVLGIDPGSRFTGYGVVESRGGRLVHIGHGVIRAGGDAPLEQRLHVIFEQLSAAVALYRPEAVAVEGLFSFRNARSALVLGHARGVALLVAAQTRLPVFEYAPAKVKRAVGAGGADGKDAVARMVHTFLRVSVLERADASDALAVAICHLNQSRSAAPPTPGRRRGWASLGERLTPSYQRIGVGR